MTKQTISLQDRHRRVDEELSVMGESATTRREWQDLRDEFENDWDYHDAAHMVLGWRRRRQQVRPVQVQSETSSELAQFAWARSLRAVAEADTEPDVQQFRHDVLADTLLTLEQVGEWVEQQRELDGPATRYVRVAMPTGWKIGDAVTAAGFPAPTVGPADYLTQTDVGVQVEFTTDALEYTADGEYVSLVPVSRTGVLGHLRTLSMSLGQRYNWQPAQATVFVLTGATPVVQMFTLTESMGSTRNRVTIAADPDVPVELVAESFKRARRRLLGPRARRPFGRGVRLVVHAAERPGVATRGLWQQWNRAHPGEQYDDLQGFRQALRNAQRRVDGRPRPVSAL